MKLGKLKAGFSQKIKQLFLKKKNFSIISDDCWGGEVYRELGLPYNTPFIGLFINPEDYLKLCQKPAYYISSSLNFVESHKKIPFSDTCFPVAKLKDIEINFMHYETQLEASQKWYRRTQRINFDNLFFKIDFCRSSPYGKRSYSIDDIYQWNKLNLDNSLAITCNNEFEIKNSIYMKVHSDNAIITYKLMRQNFSLLHWLNNGTIKKT